MKEFFKNLDMEKYHAMKHWLEEAVEQEAMAKDILSFLTSVEKAVKEEYGIEFECQLPETKEISAFCNHCEEEFVLAWNLKKHGLVVHCPYCGEEIRLCGNCPVSEKCDYDAETGCCRYCQKGKKNESLERSFQTLHEKTEKVKRVEDALSSSTQELFKYLKETYPKYWKKVVDYAQEYLQGRDIKEQTPIQKTDKNGLNSKLSYQFINENGEKDYQEVVFPGLLTENQERTILCFSRDGKFYPSMFHFPCRYDNVYQLLGFTKTKERPTTNIPPEDFVHFFCSMCQHWDFYEFLKNNF